MRGGREESIVEVAIFAVVFSVVLVVEQGRMFPMFVVLVPWEDRKAQI